jgi:type II secretory pathway pseudopilin PulG
VPAERIRGRRGQRGVTLVELSVYVLMLGIVTTIAFRLLISMTTATQKADVTSQSIDQARLAVQQIDRQVRSGNVLYDPTLESDAANDIRPGLSLRVYTQANGDQRCVQWRMTSAGVLQTRSWSEFWTTDGDVSPWRNVATNLVNTSATPAFALDSTTGFGSRLLKVTLIANVNSKRGKDVRFSTSIAGRNTEYGYNPFICNSIPPYS